MADDNIKLGLDDAEFRKGIENVKKRLQGFQGTVDKVGSSLAKTGKSLGLLGLVGAKTLKVIDIEKYKKFRNYIIALGLSTAKTTVTNDKFYKSIWRILPIWLKWVAGIGGAILAYKTLIWTLKKVNWGLLDINKTLEGKTHSLLLVHRGDVFELGKEYEKLAVELSDAQATMLQDYDDAINYFKQSSESLSLWWSLHSPWQYIKRSIVIDAKEISEAITNTIAPFIEFQNALGKYDVNEWFDEVNAKAAMKGMESDPIWNDALWKKRQSDLDSANDKLIQFQLLMDWLKNNPEPLDPKPAEEYSDVLSQLNSRASEAQQKFENIIAPISALNDEFQKSLDMEIQRVADEGFMGLDWNDAEILAEKINALKVVFSDLSMGLHDEVEPSLSKHGESLLGIGRIADEVRAKLEKLGQSMSTGEESRDNKTKSKENYFGDMSNVFAASASLASAAGELGEASSLAKVAAVAMHAASIATSIAAVMEAIAAKEKAAAAVVTLLAASATSAAALATAQSALALASATLNFVAVATAIGVIASIIGIIAALTGGGFKEGGFVKDGPGSLPDIPQAAQGMITPSNVPDSGMLVNVHGDELIAPLSYIGSLIGNLAQRVLESRSLPATSGGAGGGNTTIIINANGAFDSASFWENIARTKIRPAMRYVEYGRSS